MVANNLMEFFEQSKIVQLLTSTVANILGTTVLDKVLILKNKVIASSFS